MNNIIEAAVRGQALFVATAVLIVLAIGALIAHDKLFDTSSLRLQLFNVWAIIFSLVAFDMASWLMFGCGVLCFLLYLVTPRAYEKLQHNKQHN